MRDGRKEALEEANEILSDLAYWIRSCDPEAALRITEGFGAALARSAWMRTGGSGAGEIALALAERANALSQAKDARHVGWLLLSVKLELLQLASSRAAPVDQEPTELLQEIDQVIIELLQRGNAALTGA